MQKAESSKDSYWQAVRGLCIILVVLIHSANGLQYFSQPKLEWNYYFWIIERQIINIPVAIFIFLSGYFVPDKRVIENPKEYLRGRVIRLVPSYLIWTAFYTVLNVVHQRRIYQPVSIKEILGYFFLGKAAVPFYFIVVLIQLTLLTPFLVRSIHSAHIHQLMFLVTPIYLIFIYYYQIRYNLLIPSSQTFFPAWFIFYYLGLSLKIKGKPEIRLRKSIPWSAFLVLITLGLSFLESFLFQQNNISSLFIVSQIKFSSFLYAMSIIYFLFVIKSHRTIFSNKLLIYLGDRSFGIFYVHMVTLLDVANKIPFSIPILPIEQLYKVTLAILLSVAVIRLTKMLFPKKISHICFGF